MMQAQSVEFAEARPSRSQRRAFLFQRRSIQHRFFFFLGDLAGLILRFLEFWQVPFGLVQLASAPLFLNNFASQDLAHLFDVVPGNYRRINVLEACLIPVVAEVSNALTERILKDLQIRPSLGQVPYRLVEAVAASTDMLDFIAIFE